MIQTISNTLDALLHLSLNTVYARLY